MTIQNITQPMDKISANANGTPPQVDLNTALNMLESVMIDIINSDVTVLRDASKHILQAGGKRIRPKVVLLSHLATNGNQIDKTVKIAAAIELVHTASVVHDDINDHGVVRRGRPSVNAIWGRTFALLTGDFLFTKVYELMAPFQDLNIDFSEATVALVEGETLQAAAVKDNNFSREVYYEIIAKKTAALFKAGAILGAKMANASQEFIDALGNYGFNIGLAFQIIDDLLDLTGDVEQLGKTAGIDVEQGKGFASVQSDSTETSDPMAAIREKMMDGETIAKGRMEAEVLVQSAIEEISILPDSPAKDDLIALAKSVIEREF